MALLTAVCSSNETGVSRGKEQAKARTKATGKIDTDDSLEGTLFPLASQMDGQAEPELTYA
jgi:hypothetical protein